MELDLDADQTALAQALDSMLSKYATVPVGKAEYFVQNEQLERDLGDAGYFDVVRDMGPVGGVLLIEAVAGVPWSVEVAASALLGSALGEPRARRPIALARAPLDTPVRFLSGGGTLVVSDGKAVRRVDLTFAQVTPVESQFAYPYALAKGVDLGKAAVVNGLSPVEFQRLWQLGIAAEIVGAAGKAVDIAVEYVKARVQFGRPLGSFQVIQHRLSECAMLHRGARLLTRRAAWSGAAVDAAMAASYAQEAAARFIYETHQFHGAIGLTLEYPLHYFTYRLRRLQGELGGASHQSRAAADVRWPLQA